MSVFNDFHQVWLQRFPDAPLPGAWEEHLRLNLEKHKLKVVVLRDELRKEEIYVEYLERLLLDIGKQKAADLESKESIKTSESSDVIADNVAKPAENIATTPSAPSANLAEESESFSANLCVTEISNELSKITTVAADNESDVSRADPSTFVTVIEVNGLNKQSTPTRLSSTPPKLPAKPADLRNSVFHHQHHHHHQRESIDSSTERLSITEEPYYDVVASEEANFLESDNSSNENTLSSTASQILRREKGSQSPGASNYVNIEYFIQKKNQNEDGHSSSEEEMSEPPERTHNGSYASSSSLESSTPSSKRKFHPEPCVEVSTTAATTVSVENLKYRCIIQNIVDSEIDYVEWLTVLLNYMKALQGNVNTSQPMVTEAELSTIFYKIPELQKLHSAFLQDLKSYLDNTNAKFGECFKTWASNLEIYGSFLNNYGNAVDTVRKRCDTDTKFSEIVKNITPKHLSKQPVNLEDILHKPVARVQKNALVLHDLLKTVSKNHSEYHNLSDALQMTQTFLDQFNMIQTKSMFPVPDRAQRRLVKNSFIVEAADPGPTGRKLRHLFLFNDVIACAKYKVYFQPSSRNERYTFELKWFIPVDEIILAAPQNNQTETSTNIVSLKSQASNVRDQLRQEEKILEDKKSKSSRGSDKFKKRLIELESQLVLASPNLPFVIKGKQLQRAFTFYLSSEFERTQWIEAINTLKKTGRPPTAHSQFSMIELQTWITACRAYLKTNMGSYLLRSGMDESLLVGDLHLHIADLTGFEHKGELYVVFEVDSYGHFFQKAKTKSVQGCNVFQWNEKFVIDLEGCENLRVLVYQADQTLVGKCVQKLSRQWLRQEPVEKRLTINNSDTVLRLNLTFIPCEVSLRRVPSAKNGSLFGEKFLTVCKRQKRDIPFIITACIREVERRGMSEVGLYRVSGSSSELSRLKKSFETNSYEAEQLLKEVDIHSVTGILKLYLRELPEALFTDKLYPTLLEAFNQSNGNFTRRIELLRECYNNLPHENKETIDYILKHLMRVHKHEEENKMSMHNLATVFGPTLLRPAMRNDHGKNKETLTAGTVDVMAQAGILLCFFQHMQKC